MTDRATLFEGLQIGAEPIGARGVPVAANRLLTGIGINLRPAMTSRRFRPQGRKLDTIVAPGRRWSTGDVDGVGTYNDPVYPLASIYGVPVPTTPVGAALAREWLFGMTRGAPDPYQSYTVEAGTDEVDAGRAAHVVFTEFGLEFTTEEINVTGAVIGQRFDDVVAMTPNPTEIEGVPIDPIEDVLITVDATEAALGTTVLDAAMRAALSIGDRYNPLWVINRNRPSFRSVIETAPNITLTLMQMADAEGMEWRDVFEEGATRYVRIDCLGPLIEAGQNYLFRLDMAVKVENLDSLGDEDGVYGSGWTLRAVDDPDLMGSSVLVRNTVAVL